MAEAEELITDAARHATSFVHTLWRRHRPPAAGLQRWRLADSVQRIDLLLTAVFGHGWPLRNAQPPAPESLLARFARARHGPRVHVALPATDGQRIWLPAELGLVDAGEAARTYRLLALQQAMRAQRGSAALWARARTPLEQDLVVLLEADAADADLVRSLPGLATELRALRTRALAARPPLARFPASRRWLEEALRERLALAPDPTAPTSQQDSLARAQSWAAQRTLGQGDSAGDGTLLKDLWTGDLRAPPAPTSPARAAGEDTAPPERPTRSARLARTPRVRQAAEDEDEEDSGPGAWMVQTSQPHETAADVMGLQRPTDRDVDTAAEDFAEDLADLAEARLVATPGQASEVLLSDEPPETSAQRAPEPAAASGAGVSTFDYPEWDFTADAYRQPGARVHLLPATSGDPAWVQATLAEHRGLLASVKRGFELLKAERVILRRQLDGDDLDLDALVEARADFAAGLPLTQEVYQATRPARRSLAITLLVDISGSTDSWVSAGRRVIDVEREALLLVCQALEGLREAYCVLGFSGHGARGVTVREIKRFAEPYSDAVALRIAALEPEHYTRAGAALRYASATLMQQAARHRLLLLLSDGKPNDDDDYEGRYGVEDMRQAVVEARLQGISPFCLTIDRSAASYLARVFGARHYALLREPERLPAALLAWMRRLVLH